MFYYKVFYFLSIRHSYYKVFYFQSDTVVIRCSIFFQSEAAILHIAFLYAWADRKKWLPHFLAVEMKKR